MELEKFAKLFRNKAQHAREEHPEDPFAGHDYDDCANEIEMYLRGEISLP